MINIEPLQIPTKGTAVTLEVRVLTLTLNSESGTAYYALRNENLNILIDGNIEIPSNIFLNWGTDDKIIEDFVLQALSLTKETISE